MRLYRLLDKTVRAFFDDGCTSQAAALAYYTVFSLPPLLLIVVSVAGSMLGDSTVQARVENEIQGLAGARASEQVQVMLNTVSSASAENRGLAALLGVIAMVFGATTAFAQLQAALNQAWNVTPNPDRSEVRYFFMKRLISFGMVLCLAFLVLVSLVFSALLAAFGGLLHQYLPAGVSITVIQVANIVVTLLLFTSLFAAIHRYIPDAEVSWNDAWLGGLVTAVLFSAGKIGIGYYLGRSDVADVFGAAGSLAVILLWTYYTAIILLLGAEFTQVWSQREGKRIEASPGAIRTKKIEVPA